MGKLCMGLIALAFIGSGCVSGLLGPCSCQEERSKLIPESAAEEAVFFGTPKEEKIK